MNGLLKLLSYPEMRSNPRVLSEILSQRLQGGNDLLELRLIAEILIDLESVHPNIAYRLGSFLLIGGFVEIGIRLLRKAGAVQFDRNVFATSIFSDFRGLDSRALAPMIRGLEADRHQALKLSKSKRVIVAACDEIYYHKFFADFFSAIRQHDKESIILLVIASSLERCFGKDDKERMVVNCENTVIMFSSFNRQVRPGNSYKVALSCLRWEVLGVVWDLLHQDCFVSIYDIDIIQKRPLNEYAMFKSQGEIFAINLEHQRWNAMSYFSGSTVFLKKTSQSKRFVNYVYQYIRHVFEAKDESWHLDQVALLLALLRLAPQSFMRLHDRFMVSLPFEPNRQVTRPDVFFESITPSQELRFNLPVA
jgi:hypothetical protein